MGTFRIPLEIGDPEGQRYETVEALVDTGASYTMVPASLLRRLGVTPHTSSFFILEDGSQREIEIGRTWLRVDGKAEVSLAGISQIKPTFLEIAPSGIPSNIIPHSKGVKCGLIRSNSPFSYSNHRPAKPKIPKPLVYAQVSPLGTSFATP